MMLRGATHRAALLKSRLSIRRWKSTNAQAAAEVARKAAAAVLDVAQDVALKSLATSKTLARKANYSILDLLARNAPQEDQEKLLSLLGGSAIEKSEVAEEKKEAKEEEKAVSIEAAQRQHALLGQELADLGYKRVYLCSVGSLADLPVWEKQRVFREARSRNIAKDLGKRMRDGFVTLPGVITLIKKGGFADDVEQQPVSLEDERASLAVVDGQHRIGALAMLAAEGTLDATLSRVIVEVFPDNDTEAEADGRDAARAAADATTTAAKEKSTSKKTTATMTAKKKSKTNAYASQIFADINKAEPVKLVDLPGSSGGATEVHKEALSVAVESISSAHAAMFKPSQRCRQPHLNADNLRDDLYQAGVISRLELDDVADVEVVAAALEAWILERNAELGRRSEEEWLAAWNGPEGKDAPASWKKAVEKAGKHGLWIGMDRSWLW